MTKSLLLIGLGGGLGSIARFLVSRLGSRIDWLSMPVGTLTVNVLGCFLLGATVRWLQVSAASPALRPFLTVGLLGAFTTFSTFSFETVALVQEGQWARAGVYVGGSMAFGLAAMILGMGLVTVLTRAGGGS